MLTKETVEVFTEIDRLEDLRIFENVIQSKKGDLWTALLDGHNVLWVDETRILWRNSNEIIDQAPFKVIRDVRNKTS